MQLWMKTHIATSIIYSTADQICYVNVSLFLDKKIGSYSAIKFIVYQK